MRRAIRALPLVFCVVVLCLAASRRRASDPPPAPIQLDAHRSFAVTDVAILDGFPFERVMTALTAGTATSPVQLYQQWLDTFNAKPGFAAPDGPHCNDFMTDGSPSFNNFPRRCPTPEGLFAKDQPFTPPQFIPIGIINRFDLTPLDGSNCGQYRLIYARKLPTTDFFHIIFEAVLPNPNPSMGVAGCRPIAEFWAGLSATSSISDRRAKLEALFFQGLPGVSPVVRAENYNAPGGIRTNQDTGGVGGRMYQFRAVKNCGDAGCQIVMKPDVLENMIYGPLLDAHVTTPLAQQFRDDFVKQVATLAVPDVNEFFHNTAPQYLMAESNPDDKNAFFILDAPFSKGLTTPEGQAFSARIAAELTRIGSTLTPTQIVARADTLTCIGCHLGGRPLGEGVMFPFGGRGLQQMDEHQLDIGEDGTLSRFKTSPAMDTFIIHRMKVLHDFLANGSVATHSEAVGTVGGGRSVQ
jgi:hypothetical protein